MKTPEGKELHATLRAIFDEQGSREGPSSSDEPPTKRLRTGQPPEEPPVDPNSFLTSDPNVYRGGLGASDAPAAAPAGGYRGLGGTDEGPQQWQSMSASDQEPAPAFRSLGADDEPVPRSAAAPAAPAAAEVAPSPLAPPLRAVAMTTLKAIAREMLRQRRQKGAAAAAAAAAAGVSSMAEELEDLRQWIRFHRG